jgi:general secretion pathway protein G
MQKKAFTMLELIFVIVILGILAAIAIPKIAATRNDATATSIALLVATCVNDAGGAYIMDGSFDLSGSACIDVMSTNACYTIVGNDSDGTLSITGNVASSLTPATVCSLAMGLTNVNALSDDTTAVIRQF